MGEWEHVGSIFSNVDALADLLEEEKRAFSHIHIIHGSIWKSQGWHVMDLTLYVVMKIFPLTRRFYKL
ncbi:hypothetical protein HanHA300_Chr10g0379501 [Helianthus annuus]|nr:hypothetical protein HanHA300_Chr10g0379501 [Helianthus annuus]KAJ0531532.1 hypothetical protein HanHA89_Chr10g0402081 [Helianthus annuus]KAJ0698374.1 hypothetical protein HanLR1_Chr10g0379311 [Helianthus annuus]KAJ0885513.1 hypothetical protein HanPSC8_Chr10g0446061 [Helianthus annuus]